MAKYTIEIKWALIFALMTLAWMVLERLAGLHDTHLDRQPVITMLILIPAVVLYYLALRDKRDNFYHGVMTYKQGFLTGVILTICITVLSPLTQWITTYVISPSYFSNVIEYTVAHGILTQEEAERRFNFGSYVVQGIIGALVTGVIMSAIVALIVRKKPVS